MSIVVALPAVIIAMTFHEWAHAWVATKLGDTTPRAQGRLTLNPIKHIDPVGIVMLLFVHIGWGKPVEIDPNNFTSNKSRATCELLVAIAGPIMNFILAILFSIIYYSWSFFGIRLFINHMELIRWFVIIGNIFYSGIIINIGLGVFNLIPIPPLDGSKIFRRFLPYRANLWIDKNMGIIYIIFMILWITNLLSIIVSPIINEIRIWMLWAVHKVFSLFY